MVITSYSFKIFIFLSLAIFLSVSCSAWKRVGIRVARYTPFS